MKSARISLTLKSLLIAMLLTAVVIFTPLAWTATFTVNSIADTPDLTPGDGICADVSGNCTLRAAIQEANALPIDNDSIAFNIPGTGVQTITLTSALPTIIQPLTIDGSTQPGFAGAPLIEVNGNGVLGNGLTISADTTFVRSLIINRISGNGIAVQNCSLVFIDACYIGTTADGTAASPNGQHGILLLNASSLTIGGLVAADRNVISGNVQNGIAIQGTSSTNNIEGNYIGTNATGTAAIPNLLSGVAIDAAGNTIGGNVPGSRNLISGNNQDGVLIFNSGSQNNKVQNNYIGTDVTGNNAIPNRNGIVVGDQQAQLQGSGNNFIGVDGNAEGDANEGNIISGNLQSGILLIAAGTTANRIAGNRIGTNAAGNAALANGQNGVTLLIGPSANFIGTNNDGASDALEGNLISGNALNGLLLTGSTVINNQIRGNRIGTDITGAAALGNLRNGVSSVGAPNNFIGGVVPGAGNTIKFNTLAGVAVTGNSAIDNTILSNSISSNGGLGIDLGSDGVTANDLGDPDIGPNNFQNYPVITLAVPAGLQGMLNSTPSTAFRLEFFSNTAADPSGFGEGETFLGFINVTTDGSGNATFTFATALTLGQFVTATATGTATSEFSQAVVVIPAVVTAVEFASASATLYKGGVVLEWRTGFEVDNLGFNVYREVDGQRSLITPEPIAGSALFAGANTRMTAGKPYVWIDRTISRRDARQARYWIEDLDLNGKATLHGPFRPEAKIDGAVDLSSAVEPSALLEALQTTPPGQAIEREVMTDDGGIAPTTQANFDGSPGAAARAIAKQPDAPADTSLIEVAGQAALKVSVNRDGWYRLSPAPLFAAAGSINPAYLQLSTDGLEIPCRLAADGSIEFFGQGLDTPSTDKRIYWLTIGLQVGLRLQQLPAGSTEQTPATSFPCTLERRDRTLYFSSLLNGEAENIFGPVIRSTSPTAQSFTVKSVDAAQTAALEVRLQGVTNVPHRVRVQIGSTLIGTLELAGFASGQAVFTVPAGVLAEGANLVILQSLNSTTDLTVIERVRLTYARRFVADTNQLRFQLAAGQTARLSGFTDSQIKLYDLTDPLQVKELLVTPITFAPGDYGFTLPSSSSPRSLLAMAGTVANGETLASTLNEPSNWKAASHQADLLIVTHRDFRDAVAPLAALRRSQGLLVDVVDVEDVYDEFAFGRHTPLALQQFLQWAASTWQLKPRFVLLVGDSTWDPRNYFGLGNADFVPTKLIDTTVQETASDDQLVDFNNDGLPELAVGRLPVRTLAQASTVVAKLLAYDNTPPDSSRKAVLVADRGFESMSASLQPLIPAAVPVDFIKRSTATDAVIRSQILSAINAGPRLVHYTGHGSVTVWTSAGLLTTADGATLTNGNRLAVMVMQTCLNGYAHDPAAVSLGEAMLLGTNGGAVAVWSSSGMTESAAQQQMVRRLYEQLGGGQVLLGEAMKTAKAATTDPNVRRTWMLLGDPTTPFTW